MDFSEALTTLKTYEPMTRDRWDGQSKTAVLIAGELGAADYFVQEFPAGRVPYTPSTEDILATDWKTPPAPDPGEEDQEVPVGD